MQFTRKTSYSKSIIGLFIKLLIIAIVFVGIIFLLNKLDFPAPKKPIEKIIPNENFKIVK
ncbi:hypothetical protein OAY51_03415 [Candidatus Pelagibacter sp.]|nr:hypothetical protein [Candidatus Pelagibacter sp.]